MTILRGGLQSRRGGFQEAALKNKTQKLFKIHQNLEYNENDKNYVIEICYRN